MVKLDLNRMFTYAVANMKYWLNELITKQCFGSVIFWYGSGSSDPFPMITDPDPYPR